MPEVDIKVAGRTYRVGCGEGEENRVAELGARIDSEATALAGQIGNVTESRLLLMSALMLADKLSDTEVSLGDAVTRASEAEAAAKAPVAEAPPAAPAMDAEREAQIAANLDQLSARIETLVGRMQETA
jgi:cell division protein ZapA